MDWESLNDNLNKLLLAENGCEYTDLSDNIVNFKELGKDVKLNVLHLNIRSFLKNVDSLMLLLQELQEAGVVVHVIGICETFLTKKQL